MYGSSAYFSPTISADVTLLSNLFALLCLGTSLYLGLEAVYLTALEVAALVLILEAATKAAAKAALRSSLGLAGTAVIIVVLRSLVTLSILSEGIAKAIVIPISVAALCSVVKGALTVLRAILLRSLTVIVSVITHRRTVALILSLRSLLIL